MSSIADIVTYMRFGWADLFEALQGLSQRELTEIEIYEGWTIKDVLAHMIGWDYRVLSNLDLIKRNRAFDIPRLDRDEYNRRNVAIWRDKSLTEVQAELQSTHQQIADVISQLDYPEIDRRYERQGRTITIRSYVIEVTIEHVRQHTAEIDLWRKSLDQAIDPAAIDQRLKHSRADFMRILDQVGQADVLDKTAAGHWSISDVVGHVADWERLMLEAARHIYDPSQPAAVPVGEAGADWNKILVARRRAGKSWPENHHDLLETQVQVNKFVANLNSGDWQLRGPYPWPSGQGTLAELITIIAEHYDDHAPDLQFYLRNISSN